MGVNRILEKNTALAFIFKAIITAIAVLCRLKYLFKLPGYNAVAVCFHKLGDSVFTIPALRALQDNIKLDFYIFCFAETKPIYELYFKSDYIIGFSHNDIHFNNRVAGKNIRRKLALLNPGKIFDFTGAVTSASLLLTASAKEITGINEDYFSPLYTLFVPKRKEPHILDIYMDLIRKAYPGKDYEVYKEFPVQVNPGGYILIHPFAGWAAKEWDMSRFVDIAKLLAENYYVGFVAQAGLMHTETIEELRNNGIEVFETTSIKELIEVTKKCSLFFSNDSGPAFIANALGRPTFTIYGPTNPVFHIPYGDKHRFIQKKIVCTPVKEKYCFTNAGRSGCPSFECMKQLTVKDVWKELNKFVEELGIHKINRSVRG
jgi:ADP-heptose:LPS heptosyltransferase